ncbi:hypothetical protein GCM10007874_28830 [Labrys miyagiensis]|uniref:HTH crp-type domain-containing protein n=2 Tax=Labrys miyagiensis TaxID=346912 RepID=A0ABQ6CNS1_9HYPH|nr:hypothetical protein GCM10007874_28830 [Labrys miyagiensis]
MQILSLHLAGDLVDLQNSLLGLAHHSVQALTSVTVAWIPSSQLMALAEAHPPVARALWTDTFVNASISHEWLLNLGRRTARQRIAHLFCELALRERAIGETSHYHVPLNQDQIAATTGITVVHVNRTLQGMRADGLIRLVVNKLSILDWAALKRAGDFNSAYLHLKDSVALERQMAA